MIPDPNSAQQAIEKARQALQRGDRQTARRWAEQAIHLAPNEEEPWLLLASVSSPRAAAACLEQALQINPHSERARRGMAWALEQARRQEASTGETQPGRPSPSAAPPRPVPASPTAPRRPAPSPTSPSPAPRPRRPVIVWSLLLATVLCAAALWAFWPGNAAPALLDNPLPTPTLPGAHVEIVKPTATASPTATFLPSATATLVPSPTATHTPTPLPPASETPTPSATLLPTETATPADLASTQEPSSETPAVAGLVYVTPDTPAPALPSYSPAGGERWIDIDLSAQRLYAYEGDTVVASFVVSTGTAQYPTVTGRFRIYVKYVSANMSGPGYYLPNVPYTMYFYQGYGIHGTYWHNNFGTPMSHGCVNMRTGDAAWLFDWASVGTPVVVHP